VIEDRALYVQPTQIVRTAWIDIDDCVFGCRERMDCAAIERAYRKYLQLGDCQCWPPIVGHWTSSRFTVVDGRHELLALLASGRTKVFVAWLSDATESER
jgi:hypothetical protein